MICVFGYLETHPIAIYAKMASGNPTVDAANESTGIEPLNATPNEPQPPNQAADTIPASLASLPSGCEPVIFPLDASASGKSSNQNVSSLPSAAQFEDLVKAQIRPPGPARAEEVDYQSLGMEHREIMEKVVDAVQGAEVKVYKLEVGKGKSEWYLAGLDGDGERIVAVRMAS